MVLTGFFFFKVTLNQLVTCEDMAGKISQDAFYGTMKKAKMTVEERTHVSFKHTFKLTTNSLTKKLIFKSTLR